jgi:hypothetical protein
MTTAMFTHHSRGSVRQPREHPEGTLVVTVLLGALGLAWFAIYVWRFVNQAYSLPWK